VTADVKPYRIAIAGTGAIAGFHAMAIADLPEAELVGACGRDAGRTQDFVSRYGGAAYTDLEAMLDELQPDALCVTTPSGAHAAPVLAAATRGVHVLCEKPLEIELGRIDTMVAACKAAGVVLGAIFQQRLSPAIAVLYQAVAAGRFGDKPTINAYVPWWRDDAYYGPGRWQGTQAMDGGGALMNQSIHVVDLVQWLGGAQQDDSRCSIAEVFAFAGKTGHDESLIEVEDTASLSLRFHSGAVGQILAATSMYPGSLRRLQVGGPGGTAEIVEDQIVSWQFRDEQPDDAAIRKRFGVATEHGGGAADPLALDHANHRRNLSLFLEAIGDGKALSLDGNEARKAVAVICAAYESAASGRAVAVSG